MTRMGLAAALAAFVVFGGGAQADGENGFNVIGVGWTWAQFDEPCGGDCAVLAFVGRHTSTDMEDMFGIANFTTGELGFNEPTPIWNWRWRDSGIIGAALSRRIGAFSFGPLRDALHAELDVGLAQRFG